MVIMLHLESTPGKELPPEDPEEDELPVEPLVKLPVDPPIESHLKEGHPEENHLEETNPSTHPPTYTEESHPKEGHPEENHLEETDPPTHYLEEDHLEENHQEEGHP